MLKGGHFVELAWEDRAAAVGAHAGVRDRLAQESVALIELQDAFGHGFSARADDVASCFFVDLAAESQQAVLVGMIRQEAQMRFQQEMQRRRAAAGEVLIPGGY